MMIRKNHKNIKDCNDEIYSPLQSFFYAYKRFLLAKEDFFVYSMLIQNTFVAKKSIIIQIMRNFAAYKI